MTDKKEFIEGKPVGPVAKPLNLAPIDADKGGEEIGLMDGVKFKFEKDGDELCGLIITKEHRLKPYNSFCYQLENFDNIWFFWGQTVLDSRTEDISIPALVRIICRGERAPATGGISYTDYQVFEYVIPKGFDPQRHVAGIDPTDGQIKFYDRPIRVPQNSTGKEKGGK